MTGSKIEELLMELLQKVSSIDALLTNSQSVLRDHEHRIDVLERHPSNQSTNAGTYAKDTDIKTTLLLLLAKSLLVAVVSIGSLAGAGSILSSIFNVNQQAQT